MVRSFALLGFLCVVAASSPSSAHAQWGFPGGFGDFGWGGWGATTALGDEARGLGVFAAGMGQYNLGTAQAQSINTDTVMRFNEYMWESQQLRNQRFFQRQAERRERTIESARTIYTRLSENPERRDIHRGDALNVLMDQLSAPGVYSRSISSAHAPLASNLVREIPFKHAPQAITISLNELANHIPDIIMEERFNTERAAFKAAVEKARIEAENNDEVSTATITEVRTTMTALRTKVLDAIPVGSFERRRVNNFLKGTLGLVRMLETPELSVFLKELDNSENTTLAALMGFMQVFNLRFGVADTPRQRAAYDELFTRLRALRSQLFPQGGLPDAMQPPAELHPEWAEAFFSNMQMDDLQQRRPLTPATKP